MSDAEQAQEKDLLVFAVGSDDRPASPEDAELVRGEVQKVINEQGIDASVVITHLPVSVNRIPGMKMASGKFVKESGK